MSSLIILSNQCTMWCILSAYFDVSDQSRNSPEFWMEVSLQCSPVTTQYILHILDSQSYDNFSFTLSYYHASQSLQSASFDKSDLFPLHPFYRDLSQFQFSLSSKLLIATKSRKTVPWWHTCRGNYYTSIAECHLE